MTYIEYTTNAAESQARGGEGGVNVHKYAKYCIQDEYYAILKNCVDKRELL